MPAANNNNIRVRMYRVGFGDCFLLTLPAAGKTHQVLIDCGVHPKGDIGTLGAVVDSLAQETGGRLDLIVATHAHQDHLAGFGTYPDKWKAFTHVGEVWLPWTENDADPAAQALKKKQMALAEGLSSHFAAARDARFDALNAALMNLAGNQKSFDLLKTGLGAKVQYREAGEHVPNAAGIQGLDVAVLGPPRDQAFLERMDPPAAQRYLRAAADGQDGSANLEPFPKKWVYEPDHPLSDADVKYFDDLAAEAGEALGFRLTQAINNTSVVLLMRYGGQAMLFAGDAQFGNWQSWIEKPDAAKLLESVTFFKVAHHASENATPRGALDRMATGKFVAMIPTQDEPWPSIPYRPILEALDRQTGGRVVRSDSLKVAGAPEGPAGAKLPDGFIRGKLWFDYTFPAQGAQRARSRK